MASWLTYSARCYLILHYVPAVCWRRRMVSRRWCRGCGCAAGAAHTTGSPRHIRTVALARNPGARGSPRPWPPCRPAPWHDDGSAAVAPTVNAASLNPSYTVLGGRRWVLCAKTEKKRKNHFFHNEWYWWVINPDLYVYIWKSVLWSTYLAASPKWWSWP